MGILYAYGNGTAQSYAKARFWYEKAAEQGDADAQFHMGYLYDRGSGVDQDYVKARFWYEKAAEQGHAPAQYMTGNLYEEGAGVDQDYAKARFWYEKGAEQGNSSAQAALGHLYYDGKGVAKDDVKAMHWTEKAVAQGSSQGLHNLGVYYFYGVGGVKDLTQARKWFEKAAAQGHKDAQEALKVFVEDEQVRLKMPIPVPRLHDFADMRSIYEKVDAYLASILPRINIEDLSGWRLTFYINYQCTDLIGIDKKLGRFSGDREYEVLIEIPIPDNTQAPYGMPPGEHGAFHSGESKRSYLLDPEYDKYDNLEQYIIASAIKAIDFGLSKGFRKGFASFWKKIKFKDL